MSDIIVTNKKDLESMVFKSVREAIIEVNKELNTKDCINEKESMEVLGIKDIRTLKRRIKKNNIETFFIDSKKMYKKSDIEKIKK